MSARDLLELATFGVTIALPFAVAYEPQMSPTEQRRRNSWDDSMREWCRRDDFHNALPRLLRGEAPEVTVYIKRVAARNAARPF